MDTAALGRAMELLGRFNDDLTHVFDETFGTQWAEIEEMLAITAVATDPNMTTRLLAELTASNRRAVSRMIARMQAEGLVDTRPAESDKRAVEVVLARPGRRRVQRLRTSIVEFFLESSEIAHEISEGLGPASVPLAPAEPADPMILLRRVCVAGLSLVRVMPDATREGGLAARQRAALVQIATTGGARPQDLSTSLDVSRAGVAYIVNQLCAKGYATRRRGAVAGDQRAVIVEATPAGMQAVHAVMNGIGQQREALSRLFAEIACWRPPTVSPARSVDGSRGDQSATRGGSTLTDEQD